MNTNFLASFWAKPHGSGELWTYIIAALVLGLAAVIGCMFLPTRARRPIVVGATFLAGAFWVLKYLWPRPVDMQPDEVPQGIVEGIGKWINDAVNVVGDFSNVLTAFLLGLGIYSLLRIHGSKLIKMQKDWAFSLVLLISMFVMIFFGYADWLQRLDEAKAASFETQANWGFVQYMRDGLFEGLLQQMDAAMFSIISFYIFSAAYRAFRIRSIESTILLATALIVMLSLMGAVVFLWDGTVTKMAGDTNSFLNNFTLTSITTWIRENVQNAGIRGLEFGIGLGALAMGLRLWLSLEKGGMSS